MELATLWDSADPLGQALHFLRMSGTFYCRSELTAPWGLEMPPMEGCLWFHVVTRGGCTLHSKNFDPLEVRPGDFVLIPHGLGHRLKSQARVATPNVIDLPQEMVGERYSLLEYGGGGEPTTLICGVVRFEHPAAADLIDLLPAAIPLRGARTAEGEWMESTLRLIASEARQLRPGGETIITRLADVLVIQAIRAWLETEGSQTGWLGALKDRQVGRAMALIHRDPRQDWTVANLAEQVAMSRSAFAARFTELAGEPPMHYLARLRMRLAATALKEERLSMIELAERYGYRSEAAFSRAFKRLLGASPGSVRATRS